jgi:hypothetical protein
MTEELAKILKEYGYTILRDSQRGETNKNQLIDRFEEVTQGKSHQELMKICTRRTWNWIKIYHPKLPNYPKPKESKD